jgi:hypothetical protein
MGERLSFGDTARLFALVGAATVAYFGIVRPLFRDKTVSNNVGGISASYSQYFPLFNLAKPTFGLTLADSVNGVTTEINAGSDTIVGNELSDFVKVTPHNTVTTYRGTGTVIQEGTYSEPLKITSAVTRPELDSVFAKATSEFNRYRHALTGD